MWAPTRLIVLFCSLLALSTGAKAANIHRLQEDEVEYATDIEMYTDYAQAFLSGFRSNEMLPSAMNCTRYLEQSIMNMNSTQQNWKNENFTANMTTEDFIFNTTHWISYDLAPSSRHCTMSLLEMYSWILLKNSQFNNFGDVF